MTVVLDALLALLYKKGVISHAELQDEIITRSDADIRQVGDIEYKL